MLQETPFLAAGKGRVQWSESPRGARGWEELRVGLGSPHARPLGPPRASEQAGSGGDSGQRSQGSDSSLGLLWLQVENGPRR